MNAIMKIKIKILMIVNNKKYFVFNGTRFKIF